MAKRTTTRGRKASPRKTTARRGRAPKPLKVAVLVEKIYEDLELWYPVIRLREAGIDAVIVGPKKGETYPSKHGYPAKAELGIAQAKANQFAGVIIPGGYSPDHMRRTPAMAKFVSDINKANGVIAAICHGPWLLADAKACDGKTLTCFHSIQVDMENAGAKVVNKEVVVDGNLITSRTPADLPAFMKAILDALGAG